MYRLVYVSTAIAALDETDIGAIMDVSHSNNHERFITGFLAHNGRSFMQVLEGEESEVAEVYGRILDDPRHFGVVQIVGEAIEQRAFPTWGMNYFRSDSPKARAMIIRRDDPVDGLLPREMPRELLYLFARFMGQEKPKA